MCYNVMFLLLFIPGSVAGTNKSSISTDLYDCFLLKMKQCVLFLCGLSQNQEYIGICWQSDTSS